MDPAAPGETAARRSLLSWPSRGRLLRLVVPIPRGEGFRGKAGWVVRRVVLWYFILLIMLATFQRSLIYQPGRATDIDPGISGFEPGRVQAVSITADDGLRLNGWFVPAFFGKNAKPPVDGDEPTHPVVLFFPGNAGHRGHRGREMDLLSQLGADVYLFDYRGYGANPGRPSEQHFAADARAQWNFVTNDRKVRPARIVLFGESLGGGVATGLAAALCADGLAPGGLVLRSTFSSLVDVASFHYRWLPVRLLLIDRFPSASKISNVTCPILTFHGTKDDVVPFRLGKQLFDAAPATSAGGIAKTFVELPGIGHNDILFAAGDQYTTAVANFLARLRPPR